MIGIIRPAYDEGNPEVDLRRYLRLCLSLTLWRPVFCNEYTFYPIGHWTFKTRVLPFSIYTWD